MARKNKLTKTAIVVTPFYNTDSKLDKHFRSVYDKGILTVLNKLDYNAQLVENLIAGTNNQEIDRSLRKDNLAIIHLTQLNPSIFSKLSYRNQLPQKIIILLLDEEVEPHPRFDYNKYSHIRYKISANGLAYFSQHLELLIRKLEGNNSPDEILFPIVEVSKNQTYEEPDVEKVLANAITESYSEHDPESLLTKAQIALSKSPPDLVTLFVECVQSFLFPSSFIPTDEQYDRMESIVNNPRIIQAEDMSFSLIKKAKELYPSSKIIEYTDYYRHAHSTSIVNRNFIKTKIIERYGLALDDEKLTMKSDILTRHDFHLISFMFDAIHNNDNIKESTEALSIASQLKDKFNQTAILWRCYASCLENTGAPMEEILKAKRESIFCADVDYISILSYARTLNELNLLVDVIEVILYSCMISIDKAENFSMLAIAMSDIILPTNKFIKRQLKRSIPKCITKENVMFAVWYCRSCPDYSREKHGNRCTNALRNIGVDTQKMDDFYNGKFGGGDISRLQRSEFIQQLYFSPRMKSATTDESLYKKKNKKS